MKAKRVRTGLSKRREIHDALQAKSKSSTAGKRPGSLNRHKTGGVSTNGGSYRRSGRGSSGGSARTRSRAAVRART